MADTQPSGIFGQRVQGQGVLVPLTDGVPAKRGTGPVNLLVVADDGHIREVAGQWAASAG